MSLLPGSLPQRNTRDTPQAARGSCNHSAASRRYGGEGDSCSGSTAIAGHRGVRRIASPCDMHSKITLYRCLRNVHTTEVVELAFLRTPIDTTSDRVRSRQVEIGIRRVVQGELLDAVALTHPDHSTSESVRTKAEGHAAGLPTPSIPPCTAISPRLLPHPDPDAFSIRWEVAHQGVRSLRGVALKLKSRVVR